MVHLDDNHRSSPQVVAAAAAVLGRQSTGTLRSSQPDGPLPRLRSFPSEDAEAAGVATHMRQAHGGGMPWCKMAALARTNSQLCAITAALASAGIPFRALAPAESLDVPGPLEPAGGPPDPDVMAGPVAPAGRPWDGGTQSRRRPGDGFHLPPGQGAAMGGGMGLRAGGRHCTHRLRFLFGRSGRGAAPALRGGDPVGTRALLFVGQAETRPATGRLCGATRARGYPCLAAHCADGEDGLTLADGGARPTARAGISPPGAPDAAVVDFFASARGRLARSKSANSLRRTVAGGEEPAADPEGVATTERLREWRRRLARASGVPPHVLLHDATVQVIAARRPTNTEELLAVPGLGPVKVARFGPAILEVVRQAPIGPVPDGPDRCLVSP